MLSDYTLDDIQSPFDPIGSKRAPVIEDQDEDFEPDASDTGGEDEDEVDSDYLDELDANPTPDSLKRHRLVGSAAINSVLMIII